MGGHPDSLFRKLAEAAPDTITVLVDGVFVYANKRAVELLGYADEDELLGRRISEMMPADEVAAFVARIPQVMAGEHLEPIEYRAFRKDGRTVTMEISSIRVDFDGKPGIMAIGRDTSERKRWQTELVHRDRLATIGMMAASVAHEINNPLTYVLLHLSRLRRLLDDNSAPISLERLKSILDEGLDGAARVRDVVRDLLAFAHPGERDSGPVQVARVVESALKLAGYALDEFCRVEVELDPEAVVVAHEARLGQAVLNLLVNAAQAFEEQSAERNLVRARVFRRGREVVVEVSDNGAGIPPGVLDRVFEPFFTTKGAREGTGLGLAITKSIAEELGGAVEIESGVGCGTTVRIRLPGALAARPPAES